MNGNAMSNAAAPTVESNDWARTDAIGSDSRGKYTLPTSWEFPLRLVVAKPIAPTKNAHGTALTAIPAISLPSTSLPDT